MIKKHRTLLIVLLCLLAGAFACYIALVKDDASREASAQINGYRIDFVYSYDPEFVATELRITRPDGKSVFTPQRIKHVKCPSLTIQNIGSRLYFLCSDETLSAGANYLDTKTMLLYNGERDDTPTPIDSLDYR
jgi:hypothetical protein